jgi:hypothetical protein
MTLPHSLQVWTPCLTSAHHRSTEPLTTRSMESTERSPTPEMRFATTIFHSSTSMKITKSHSDLPRKIMRRRFNTCSRHLIHQPLPQLELSTETAMVLKLDQASHSPSTLSCRAMAKPQNVLMQLLPMRAQHTIRTSASHLSTIGKTSKSTLLLKQRVTLSVANQYTNSTQNHLMTANTCHGKTSST